MTIFTRAHTESLWSQRKRAIQVLGVTLGLLWFCFPAFSQLNLGRIFGAVTDQSGGVIASATVTVIDVARGVSRPLTTDNAGEYSAPSLIPGTYTLRAEAKGFQTVERHNVLVEVGQDLRVDLTLQPGEQSQTITVTESLPMVNTTNAAINTTMENQSINDLPLNGREYSKLLEYRPGTVANGSDYYDNGNRAGAVDWMFDGLDDLNAYSASGPVAGGQQSFDEASILPIDAIQEVNIISNPNGEYGWKPGAAVNVGLKSGTNSIHGTAYAFGRDTALDARNAFVPSNQPRALDNLEQFGTSIGGPIKKDKIFYFGAYEGQRFTVGSPQTIQVPGALPGGGTTQSIPDAINDMKTNHSSVPISPLSLKLAGCTQGPPVNCNAASGLFGNATNNSAEAVAFNNVGGSDNGIVKIDYHLNEKNALNGEYFFGDGNTDQVSSSVQPFWRTGTHNRAQVARGVWVWTPTSTWVNEARFGYDRLNNPTFPAECSAQQGLPDYAALGFVSGAPLLPPNSCGNFPVLGISGFTNMGASSGQSSNFYTVAGLDNISYTRGKHLFKFGMEIHDTVFKGSATVTSLAGSVSFGTAGVNAFSGATPLEDFLAGLPSAGALLLGNPIRLVSMNRYAGFIQDDWRLTRKLTVNLGLRYEYQSPITDVNNLLGNFDPTAPTGLVQAGNQVGRAVYGGRTKDFSPRLGFAWDVTGKGTTVVRAGGSLMYNTLHLSELISAQTGAGLSVIPTGFSLYDASGKQVPSPGNINTGLVSFTSGQLNWASNTPVFNGGLGAHVCGNGLVSVAGLAQPPTPCNISPINPNVTEGYVTTWNLAVQHAVAANTSLTVAYIGTHGTNLDSVIDVNVPTLGAANGKAAPANEAEQLRRPYYNQFPYLGQILQFSSNLVSNYDALQLSMNQRVSHGLSVNAAFTWAHALDENSAENTNTHVMSPNNPRLDYGNGRFDIRNHFTFTATYAIPGHKSPGQLLEGWSINSIVNLLSAAPYNALDGSTDLSGTGEAFDRWTIVGNPSNFQAAGPGSIPCFGIAGSSFAKAGCITVASFANFPALCQSAAASESTGLMDAALPVGATLPWGGTNTVTTGTTSLQNLGCYFEGNAALVPPAQGTYGTLGRDVLRGLPVYEWDFSAAKEWKFKERLTAQFRAEFFNILNFTLYAIPAGNLNSPQSFGQSQATANSGNPIVGSGGPRQVQLGLKLIF